VRRFELAALSAATRNGLAECRNYGSAAGGKFCRTATTQLQASKELIEFLRTPEAAAVIRAKGMEPADS
jgi:hypothetical protein